MRIRTQCRSCGLPFPATIEPGGELTCPSCHASRRVAEQSWTDDSPGSVKTCPLCGCKHLYRQRDFNRVLGCGLVVVGALLVPWTYGLSLVVLSLVDLALYMKLRDAVVCYR